MADNVVANAGSGGATFATDDITGVHHPLTKIEWGPADTANQTDDASGKRLPVKVGDPLPAGTNNIGDVDVLTLPNVTLAAGTNTNEVVGDAAHDAAAAGNPLLQGGYASAAAPTDVTADGDAVRAWHLRNGAAATVITAAGALVGGDATNGLDVDVTRLPALAAGTNNIGDVDVLTLPALPAGTNNIGDVDVLTLPALPAGTNTIGQVGLAPQTSGGLSISRVISAATTNATSAKGSAGQVFGWYLSNVNAAVRYLKLYNKATAPTVGTDTPVMTIAIPGNTAGAGANVEFANGIAFATGIGYAITTGVADADTGAVAANEIVVNLLYK